MSIISIAAILIGALLTLGFVIEANASNKAATRIKSLLSELDNKYAEFIEKRITYSILDKNDVDIDKKAVLEEAVIILKPQINALISLINATTVKKVKTELYSEYFSNIISVADSMFLKSQTNDSKRLTGEDEQRIRTAFYDAINSDIAKRILDLKTSTL